VAEAAKINDFPIVPDDPLAEEHAAVAARVEDANGLTAQAPV
jgi:hypothetical protein